MIHAITSDHPTFRPVTFSSGFNIILADHAAESTEKDSRNGLGKSTLIEIIHFCLGAEVRESGALSRPQLENWSFTLELDVGPTRLAVTRNTADSSKIQIEGDSTNLPLRPSRNQEYSSTEWCDCLGQVLFGLPPEISSLKYGPKFRSLINYFACKGKDAYSTPFEFFRRQPAWSRQVNTAYLL